MFPIYWLTHLNFACVNWRQRYSIDKRPTLAAEFTAALGGRTSQSMEAGNSKSWDGLETKPLAKESCNWGVLGAGLSLLCLLMWFHQQVSRTHFHHLQPIKSISCGGSHAWTCRGRRWLCWTTTLIPGRTEQTQWGIADICLGSSKTQVVVWIQAEKKPYNRQHAFFGAPISWFLRTPSCLVTEWRIFVAKWDWHLSSLGKSEVQICFKFSKSLPNRAMDDKITRTANFDAREHWHMSFLEIRTHKDFKELRQCSHTTAKGYTEWVIFPAAPRASTER